MRIGSGNFPKAGDFEAITSRFIQFTNDAVLRKVFASPNPEINLWDVMQENKILLVDLADTETDNFIASLIVAGIQQATFRRRIHAARRAQAVLPLHR